MLRLTAKRVDRRVVGMDADVHPGGLGHRSHPLNEVREILPELFLRGPKKAQTTYSGSRRKIIL